MDVYRCPHCHWRLFDASMPDGGRVETKCAHCKQIVSVVVVKGKVGEHATGNHNCASND